MHYLLFYSYGPDIVTRRAPHRQAHLRHAWQAQATGLLVLAGAYADPVDGAAFVFQSDSAAAVEAFARSDPYVLAGLVERWTVRAWTTVVGAAAHNPVTPESVA